MKENWTSNRQIQPLHTKTPGINTNKGMRVNHKNTKSKQKNIEKVEIKVAKVYDTPGFEQNICQYKTVNFNISLEHFLTLRTHYHWVSSNQIPNSQ